MQIPKFQLELCSEKTKNKKADSFDLKTKKSYSVVKNAQSYYMCRKDYYELTVAE